MQLRESRMNRYFSMLETGELCFCHGKKSSPDPPDYEAMAAANKEIAEMQLVFAREQQAWAEGVWAEQKDLLQQVVGPQVEKMRQQLEQAGIDREWYMENIRPLEEAVFRTQAEGAVKDRQRYEEIYQPLEENLVREFQRYDTPARREQQRASAIADVTQAFDAQRENAARQLESYGVDPSQTRYQALDSEMRTREAAAQAGAANMATQNTEAMGRALRSEALNIGRGYPSNVAGAYGQTLQAAQGYPGQALAAGQQGLAAGNAAIGNFATGAGVGQSARMSPNAYLQGAGQNMAWAGNTLNQGYANEVDAWKAEQANNPFNTILGAAAGAGSSKLMSLFAEGGEVRGPGGPKGDAIPARVSDGEYVVPEEVVRRKGTEFFDKLTQRVREEEMQRQQAATPRNALPALGSPQAIPALPIRGVQR